MPFPQLKRYGRVLALGAISLVLAFHAHYFPETPEMLMGDLAIWRGLPTAIGHGLIAANVGMAVAEGLRLLWRSRRPPSQA